MASPFYRIAKEYCFVFNDRGRSVRRLSRKQVEVILDPIRDPSVVGSSTLLESSRNLAKYIFFLLLLTIFNSFSRM